MKTIYIFLFAIVLLASCGSERIPANGSTNMDSTEQMIDTINDYETDTLPY